MLRKRFFSIADYAHSGVVRFKDGTLRTLHQGDIVIMQDGHPSLEAMYIGTEIFDQHVIHWFLEDAPDTDTLPEFQPHEADFDGTWQEPFDGPIKLLSPTLEGRNDSV